MIAGEMVLARPGFNPRLKREVSWDELKRTFTLYKRIPMIVAAGAHHGPIDPNIAVGHVDAKIHDDAQVIRGDPTFYRNRFEDIPAEIQRRLAERRRVHASLGYEPFENIRKIDHILIGADKPVFPDIGFNAESGFIYEETEGMNKEDPVTEEAPKQEAPRTVTLTEEQFEKLLSTLRPTEQPPQDTPSKEEVTEEQHTEEAPIIPEEPPLEKAPPPVEPERVIPRSTTSTSSSDGWQEDEFGRRFMSTPVGGEVKDKK